MTEIRLAHNVKITPEIIGLVTTTICKVGDVVEINGTDYPIERITQQSGD